MIAAVLITLASGLLWYLQARALPKPASFEQDKRDIRYIWNEGRVLRGGEDPYLRTLTGNDRDNDKYPTLLPAMYLFAAATQTIWPEYLDWLVMWRWVATTCYIAAAALLLYIMRDRFVLGILLFLLLLFGRWSVILLTRDLTDAIPVLLLVAGIILLPRRVLTGCVLVGMSIAIKHVAVLAMPIILMAIWRSGGERPWRRTIHAALMTAAIPCLISLPFLIWHPEAFIRSILFSATREAAASKASGATVEQFLGITSGLGARTGMLVMLACVYLAYLVRDVSLRTAIGLVLLVFACFNAVLFPQYLYWMLVGITLCLSELPRPASRSGQSRVRATNLANAEQLQEIGAM